MNREEHLQKTFPLKDGTTYIQSLDKHNEPKGVGVGGESFQENFFDSNANPKNKVVQRQTIWQSQKLSVYYIKQ